MGNFSEDFIFMLSGLNDTRRNKQVYFAFALLLYLSTVFANLLLIITIFLDKMLRRPMYLLICNMCVNGIFGASGLYPKLLADLLSDRHGYVSITYNGCMAQISVIYTYVFCEFTNLTIMAYDRYVAICKPLEYHSIVTSRVVGKLMLFTWLFSILETSIGLTLTIQLPLCGFVLDKVFCTNWEVVKLACTDTMANNLYGYILMVTHISQAILIIISYVHIVKASLNSKAEKGKFMQTCLPHLITLINFSISLLFDALYGRYGNGKKLRALRNILAIEFLVVPPLLNPIIYGMRLTQIRTGFMKMWRHNVIPMS